MSSTLLPLITEVSKKSIENKIWSLKGYIYPDFNFFKVSFFLLRKLFRKIFLVILTDSFGKEKLNQICRGIEFIKRNEVVIILVNTRLPVTRWVTNTILLGRSSIVHIVAFEC